MRLRFRVVISLAAACLALGAAVASTATGEPNVPAVASPHVPVGNGTADKPGTATAPGLLKPKPTGDDGAETTTPAADAPAAAAPETAAEPAAPVRGESVGLTPTDGTVRVRAADGTWAQLQAGETVPNGTVVDARQGTLTLSTVVDAAGTRQAAAFSGAMFSVAQPRTTGPVTELKLHGGAFDACRPGLRRVDPFASIAARRKPVRSLFGSGHGRFRTRGKFAAATVRGTIWITEDYCDRTVVRVKRGVVGVKDLRSGQIVNVHAGHSRTVGRR